MSTQSLTWHNQQELFAEKAVETVEKAGATVISTPYIIRFFIIDYLTRNDQS